MINAIISHKDKTIVEEFPMKYHELYASLNENGIYESPRSIPLTDNEEDDIRVKLYSDNDFGSHLLLLFNENDTLGDVHTAIDAVAKAPDEVKETLEEYILHDQLENKENLYETLRELREINAPIVTTFYCPLTAKLHDSEYGEMHEVSNGYVAACAEEIDEALKREQSPDLEMADYITDHPTADEKLLMATWTVDMIDGTLYGRIDCRSTESFTAEEIQAIKEGISVQNSNGFGEEFEQQPLNTDKGDLYVAFWHYGDDYFIHTQAEMDEYIEQQQEMRIGGM